MSRRDEARQREARGWRLAEQAAAASLGTLASALVSTPLETVKVRQQLATFGESARGAGAGAGAGVASTAAAIVRKEGLPALWSGLQPTLLMSVPNTVLYLTVYEAARDALVEGRLADDSAPLLAGGGARLIASTVISPFELVRTRMQAGAAEGATVAVVRQMVATGGFLSLWRGFGATLLRDVPFSCVYWFSYELLRKRAIEPDKQEQVSLGVTFTAGAAAGASAFS